MLARMRTLRASSRGTYGAPRIFAQFAREGMYVGRERVARLMRMAGLCWASRRPCPRTKRQRAGARRAAHLTGRRFSAEAVDVLWVADATYLRTDERFLYLAVVLDVFSRRIVGRAIFNHLSSEPIAPSAGHDIAAAPPRTGNAGPVRLSVCRGHETITEMTSYDRYNSDREEQQGEGTEAVSRWVALWMSDFI
ncbi:IS3 family transposase [Paraburkholderia sp. RL17-373-BIF-A]|uniref:IS3 family transposase n=1 Tax=Paraburkholderia sp. RL17-373-BIF-A TaxID=3031629 RepID=UPI0038BABCA9